MTKEKKSGDSTSRAASRTDRNTLSELWALRSCSVCRIRSTMISEPSTIMPKSRAPRLSRFAGMPVKYMQPNANSSASRIVIAVRRAAFTLPRKSSRIRTTITNPSSSVLLTV